MKKTLKWSLMMMLAVVGLTFASCSDDDDNTPTVGTVEDVNGEFTGKMTYVISEEKTEATLDLIVKNDSVSFEAFPYKELAAAIVGKEAADALDLGDLKYNVFYTATMNAAKDSVIMTLDPKPLEIALSEEAKVVVTITAENKASYAINEKNLKFNLKATEAKLGAINALKDPIDLSFDMKKK